MAAQKKYSTRAAVEAAKRQLFGHKLMRRQLLLSNKKKKINYNFKTYMFFMLETLGLKYAVHY